MHETSNEAERSFFDGLASPERRRNLPSRQGSGEWVMVPQDRPFESNQSSALILMAIDRLRISPYSS